MNQVKVTPWGEPTLPFLGFGHLDATRDEDDDSVGFAAAVSGHQRAGVVHL